MPVWPLLLRTKLCGSGANLFKRLMRKKERTCTRFNFKLREERAPRHLELQREPCLACQVAKQIGHREELLTLGSEKGSKNGRFNLPVKRREKSAYLTTATLFGANFVASLGLYELWTSK